MARLTKINKWKLGVGLVVLAGFVAHIIFATLVAVWGVVNPEDRVALYTHIFVVYGPHFGTIVGGLLVARKLQGTRPPGPAEVCTIAGVVLTWTTVLTGRYALFTFDLIADDTLAEVAQFQLYASGIGGIPIAAALAFLYARK